MLFRSSFSRRRRENEMERRKRTATKAGSAKTNRPDFNRGKQPVFPSGEKLKQEADANHPFPLFRPNANSFFEKRVTGKHTKKEFGRTYRGKSGFPSVPQGTGGRCPCEPFTLLGKTDRLSRSCFAEVVIRGARAANRSESSIKK